MSLNRKLGDLVILCFAHLAGAINRKNGGSSGLVIFSKSKLKLTRNKTNKKYDQKIGIAFYGDHNLIIASTIVDLNNNIKVIS